ncbi:MAG: helix-turn-helix transcriptional regulator [Saprospiraceae bacterium]|nr:helix-turn-helix transcriptional regulator [Saprospiraceae bacterium]
MLTMSRAQLHRKLTALTGMSATHFIRLVRLRRAKELLLTTNLSISEIAYEVGFRDPNYFSRTFTEEFGTPPSETRK